MTHMTVQWFVVGLIGGWLGMSTALFFWRMSDKVIDRIFRGTCTKCGRKL